MVRNALFLLLALQAACGSRDLPRSPPEPQSTSPALSQAEIEREGRRFLDALLSRDLTTLQSYEPYPGAFFVEGALKPTIDAYLYAETVGDPRFLSVVQIARKGELAVMLDGENADEFTILFHLQDRRDRMRDMRYLRDGERWILRSNFCFEETDGPYPNQDPDL